MPITIHLNGDEESSHVHNCVRAVSAYAGISEPVVISGTAPSLTVVKAVEETKAAETTKGETAAQKKAREKAEKEAAAAQAAVEAEAAAAAEAADTGPDLSVDDIRAVAGKFNNDETRPKAVQILADHGATSVSWFKDKPKAARAAVHAALVAKLAEIENAALN
jgi:hypothetical protein